MKVVNGERLCDQEQGTGSQRLLLLSAEPSEVTNPKGPVWPAERSACKHSIPVICGMFQALGNCRML